jgi:hypothetical protein
MTEDQPMEIDAGIKRNFLATIPPDLHDQAEQYIERELAAGRLVWRRGSSACQA